MTYNQTNSDKSRKKIIGDYMSKQLLAVVSTKNEFGDIESAVVAFTETDDLELIFQTPNSTRKYKNLKHDSQVAVVIGWDLNENITIQYEGIAIEADIQEIDKYRKIQLLKHNRSKKYAFLEENKYFKISPKWIRYSDLKTDPPIIFTLEF